MIDTKIKKEKNKKGDMEEILKIVLWVIVFALLLWGVYTLYQKLIA